MTHLPTIHLNGTSADSLYNEYRALRKSVNKTIDTLVAATCNPRDFYPQEPGAWEAAKQEREQMLEALRKVYQYAEDWEAHAYDRLKR